MAHPFDQFADSFTPLDITQLAIVIGNEWAYAYNEGVKMAIEDLRAGMEAYPRIRYTTQAKYMDRIVETLKAYDEGRTRHIKFLTGELIKMHSLLPTRTVLSCSDAPVGVVVDKSPPDGSPT